MSRALIVDDDPQVRMLLGTVLRTMGCQVEQAGDAEAARALAAEGDVALLVTDVSLGHGTSGLRLAQQVHELHPDARVLFVSGHDYGELVRVAAREGVPAPVDGRTQFIVRKPFGLAELRDAVTRLLSSGRPMPWSPEDP